MGASFVLEEDDPLGHNEKDNSNRKSGWFTSSSSVSSESKKTATLSVLKLTEEKQEEHRSEILQSWEDVAHKVVKALSELI